MKASKIRKFSGILFFCLVLILSSGQSFGGSEERITKSFDVRSGGQLTVDTDLGSIQVETARGNTVNIEVSQEVRALGRRSVENILNDFRVRFDQKGEDVFVRAEYRKNGFQRFWDRIGNRLRVRFYITVPEEYGVDLHTSGGSISVKDLAGEVVCKTSGGSLTFENIKGDIEGRTSGGSIRIGRIDGQVFARTSGGSIRIEEASGEVEAHTSGGSITVEEVMGAIQASTSGGSVRAYISRQPEADCRLTTSGGTVTVYLDEDIALDVDARASGGRIHTDFPIKVYGTDSPRSLEAEVNGGGPELYLRTSGGSIHLKKR